MVHCFPATATSYPVANAAAIQNVIDFTRAVRDLQADGYFVRREDLAQLSPLPDAAIEAVRRLHPLDDFARTLRYRPGRAVPTGRCPGISRGHVTRYFLFLPYLGERGSAEPRA
jgi:hypothetical protein